MKKTILIYESSNESPESTIKMEGPLIDLMIGAGEILMEVSKAAAKASDEEPEAMVLRIAGTTLDMLKNEKKGEANE